MCCASVVENQSWNDNEGGTEYPSEGTRSHLQTRLAVSVPAFQTRIEED